MKWLAFLITLIALMGCSNPVDPQTDKPVAVHSLYQYDWHNPRPFIGDSGGGDGHWFNTVRNEVMNASKWEAHEGYVGIEPFTGFGSYSILMLILPFDSVSSAIFSFSLTSQGQNTTGLLKVNAITDTGFTVSKIIDLSTLQNGTVEYSLPSAWEAINIQVFSNATGYTPTIRVSNTMIK